MQAKRKIASPAQPEPAAVFLQQRLKNNQDHKRQQKDQKQSLLRAGFLLRIFKVGQSLITLSDSCGARATALFRRLFFPRTPGHNRPPADDSAAAAPEHPSPAQRPWRSTASMAYSEQVGTYRQAAGSMGEMAHLYAAAIAA